ncbi:hypothetical protein DL95DRAFT_441599 [Leptodontidium sp. 2 PMI_412]|nr:hypothetical protein DL95DRAFT_441599 [Leptodontidium sp. 2 PMI_412]
MVASSLIAFCLLFSAVVRSQSPGTFINPSPQDASVFGSIASISGTAVYTVGNLLNITWVPLASGSMTIVMWQVDPKQPKTQIGDLQYLPGSSRLDSSHYTWNPIGVDGNNGNPKFDLSTSNVFYFALYQTNGITPLSVTSFFNLTDSKINAVGLPISATTSSITPSSSSTSSSTTTASQITAAVPSSPLITSAATSTPTGSSGSPGMSTGAKVGIGLGVALGVAILVALLTGIFLLLKRRKATPDPPPVELTAGKTEYKQEMPSAVPSPQPHLVSAYGGPSPLRHELPSYQ